MTLQPSTPVEHPHAHAPTSVAAEGSAPGPRRKRDACWSSELLVALGAAVIASAGVCAGLWMSGVHGAALAREGGRQEAACVAATVAAGLSPHCDLGPSEAEAVLARFGRHEAVVELAWLDGTGRALASWPTARVREAARGERVVTADASVGDESGQPKGKVRVGVRLLPAPPLMDARRSALASTTGLAVFACVWIGMQRSLRGARAIEQSLRDYARGTERELLALAISDSLGEGARGWNQILSETVSLRQELQVRSEVEKTAAILGRFDSGAYRRMLDQLPIGVVRIDAANRVRYVNPAGRSFLGATREAPEGADAHAVFDDEALQRALAGLSSGAHCGQTLDRTIREGDREAALRYHVLPSSDGTDAETVVLIEDLGQIRELERARDQFLYHVTHELRTPLTNIRAYVETLTRPDFDEEQTRKECYNVIVSETARLTRLVEDVLSVSQLEVGTLRLDLAEVELARVLRQIVQDNLGAADEKGVALTLKLPPKVPKVRADKQRLAVLVTNVVGNAVKYTPSGGRVDVSVTVDDVALHVAVSDTGIGIAPEEQARVFEKFYRASSSAVQSVTGTGLGLAIAREIARMHGGDIRLTSQVGKGSTFTIDLPVLAEVAA